MKKSTLFYLSLASILLGACASTGTNLGAPFGEWETGERRQYVKVTFVNNHAFSPSTTTTMMLECRYLRGTLSLEGKTDEEILNDSRCRPADVGNHDVGAGILPGFGGAMIQSAGIVGSAYLIGKGLADSGDTYSSETNLKDESYTSNNNQHLTSNNPVIEIDNGLDIQLPDSPVPSIPKQRSGGTPKFKKPKHSRHPPASDNKKGGY